MELPIKGWTALTDTIAGYELIWKMEDNNDLNIIWPDIYPTEKEVWLQIAMDQIEQRAQLIDGTRQVEEVDWDTQEMVVQIDIDEDGEMVIKDSEGGAIFAQSLKEWRESI